jgi:hypothetical protein
MGEWRYGSTILYLGDRWKWVVSFSPMSFYAGERSPRFAMYRRLGVPQSLSGRYGEKKTPLPILGIEPEFSVVQSVN